MHNYSQQPQGYQRPGSAASFAGHGGPPPPPYGTTQGYQSATPSSSSQWAPPPPPAQHAVGGAQQWNQSSQTSQQGSWGGQQQQGTGGYNPNIYGAMPGTYNQVSATHPQYSTQQHDQPPPPPPKPQGYPSSVPSQQVQQNTQSWAQQPAYGVQHGQQNFGSQNQQGGYPQHVAYPNPTAQHSYENAAPPPPSQTPGGSYFPPAHARPGSIYGVDQVGTYTTPSSAVATQPPSSVLSPSEQQPAYIPPSLTGQGVQSYMPVNTNPQPGVYIPPPPDIPAWQQATHAPLQGATKKFQYTKPIVGSAFQGQQGLQQQAQQHSHYDQPSIPTHPNQQSYGQPTQTQFQTHHQHQGSMQPGQFVHPSQPLAQQFVHPEPHQNQLQQTQQPHPYGQQPQTQPVHQPTQQYPQQADQWQPTPPADQGFVQQQPNVPEPYAPHKPVQPPPQSQQWQAGYQAQVNIVSPVYPQEQDHGIQAPKPVNGHTGTTPPGFVNQTSPHSQPVSPVHSRQSISFASTQPTNLGRTGSVSSIAISALRNQQAENKPSSPAPAPAKIPTPPPPRDHASAFSALGTGGPSDWEHFGPGHDEVDDEEYFGAKKEEKDQPAQVDSVELPAQTPPPAEQWPTPDVHPAPLDAGLQRQDTYQPTPPPPQQPVVTLPQGSSHVPAESIVVDNTVNASKAPPPAQVNQPPAAQHSFVVDDGGWQLPKKATPAQELQNQPPPPQGNTFVNGEGSWADQTATNHSRNQTPAQHSQPPPSTGNTFVIGDSGLPGSVEQMSTQRSGGEGQDHTALLKAKDEEIEHLRVNAEKEKANMQAEVERIRTELENAMGRAASEQAVLNEQIESLKAAAEQTKSTTDSSIKEKDINLERLKEDMEGKDGVIQEKEAAIRELKKQLDAEKAKEIPKPTPADLIPDIDPWYAGSLERYVTMLRSEAMEPQVEDKIKIFQSFLRAESGVRGLEYSSALPPAPAAQEHIVSPPDSEIGLSRGVSNASIKKQDLHVQVPEPSPLHEEETIAYSPGGRPLLQRKPTLKSDDSVATEQSFIMSAGPEKPPPLHITKEKRSSGGPILTPTSSNDDEFNKTPIQSPPEEPLSQYKAYVPPASTSSTVPLDVMHRQSISFPNVAPVQPLNTSKGKSDEIFFGEPQPTSKSSSRPTTSASSISDVPVPAQLSFTHKPAAAQSPRKLPIETLADLLPKKVILRESSPRLEEIRKQARALPSDFTYIAELTSKWEKAAAQHRAKLDRERQKRQEESEAHTDELFNDNEISYADIGAIEDEFKEKERDLKAQEDRDEYKTYVEEVFDKVYDGLQGEIKQLMGSYIEVEALLHSSVSGVQSLSSNDAPSTKETLSTLTELHAILEIRHDKVVQAVAERDKRYKKTEIQPLYARGDIKKMKSVEKHFENAERQALVRAKGEKADRVAELVRLADEIVVRNVGIEQGEVDRILTALKGLSKAGEGSEGQTEVVGRARDTLSALKTSSKALLSDLNALEITLNTAVLEAEIAQARASGADASKIADLQKEMKDGETRLVDEFRRRITVLDQDNGEIDAIVREKGGDSKSIEEQEKARRMSRALEEAKRRNGEL